ncbi:hypothetical protein [Amycolatopsis sp. NBRC 101858]|uniref:hypothetical protein n=1 Tax=Amycolatopsis sp. NBRC 101858 TaxID=3032200 RepID=UPI0025540DD9|nr:hypothetical protein [Amycolatopsis sp. NBRC 101858]
MWAAAARWLELPLSRLLGRVHEQVDVYGSGERLFFDDCLDPTGGTVSPTLSAPGHGLAFRTDVAAEHAVRRRNP